MVNFEGLATENSISQNCVCKVFTLPTRLGCNIRLCDRFLQEKKTLNFV
jgi:hypothetical protein